MLAQVVLEMYLEDVQDSCRVQTPHLHGFPDDSRALIQWKNSSSEPGSVSSPHGQGGCTSVLGGACANAKTPNSTAAHDHVGMNLVTVYPKV